MNDKIQNFLKKWNEMLQAANEIEEFKYDLKLSVASNNEYKMEREGLISGVNKSFVENGMNYQSSSRN